MKITNHLLSAANDPALSPRTHRLHALVYLGRVYPSARNYQETELLAPRPFLSSEGKPT